MHGVLTVITFRQIYNQNHVNNSHLWVICFIKDNITVV